MPERHVELDRPEIGRPGQRGNVVDHCVGDDVLAVVGRDIHRGHPLRRVRRDVLLEEELALDAVGKSLHRQRPLPNVRQHDRSDADVVVDELTLGEAALRKEHLLEIRDGELPAPDGRPRGRGHHSTTTSSGALSGRRPRQVGWRSLSAVVHSPNSTSPTSSGRTKWAVPASAAGSPETNGLSCVARALRSCE